MLEHEIKIQCKEKTVHHRTRSGGARRSSERRVRLTYGIFTQWRTQSTDKRRPEVALLNIEVVIVEEG
jgi:hypothetical protein